MPNIPIGSISKKRGRGKNSYPPYTGKLINLSSSPQAQRDVCLSPFGLLHIPHMEFARPINEAMRIVI